MPLAQKPVKINSSTRRWSLPNSSGPISEQRARKFRTNGTAARSFRVWLKTRKFTAAELPIGTPRLYFNLSKQNFLSGQDLQGSIRPRRGFAWRWPLPRLPSEFRRRDAFVEPRPARQKTKSPYYTPYSPQSFLFLLCSSCHIDRGLRLLFGHSGSLGFKQSKYLVVRESYAQVVIESSLRLG